MRLIVITASLTFAAGGLLLTHHVDAQEEAEPSGQELFEMWCADCHDPGPGHPGTLRMEGDFGVENSVLREMQAVNRPLIHLAVRRGFAMMPPFRPTEISDEELERIASYILEEGE